MVEETNRLATATDQLTYSQLSKQMTELLVKMEDIPNKEVVPVIVSMIKTNPPKEDGWLQILGPDGKCEPCWCLYCKDVQVKDDATYGHWWLLRSDGKVVMSRSLSYLNWSFDDYGSFGSHTIEDTDTQHHCTIYVARLFYGLLQIGEKCGISENVLSFWKKNFDELYGQYHFLRETQLIQVQTDRFNQRYNQ